MARATRDRPTTSRRCRPNARAVGRDGHDVLLVRCNPTSCSRIYAAPLTPEGSPMLPPVTWSRRKWQCEGAATMDAFLAGSA
jgi:hypothetical protein